MKVLLAAIALAAPFVQEPAPEQALAVVLPSDWAVGARLSIVLEKVREKSVGHQREVVRASRTAAELEVLARTVDGFRVAWTWGATELEPTVAGANARLAERLATVHAGTRLELSLDSFGSVRELLNVDELVQRYERVLAELDQTLAEDGMSAERRELALSAVRPLLEPEVVLATATEDAALFLAMSGGSFAPLAPVEFEDSLPNPLGGPRIASRGVVELTDHDTERATIRRTLSADPRQAAISAHAAVQQLSANAGRALTGDDAVPKLAIEDEATWTFDRATGWPVACRHERRTSVNDRAQVERRTFTAAPSAAGESR
ncbi:MAG: hypothetical protein WD226_03590 [Planctomycetota bacterium]